MSSTAQRRIVFFFAVAISILLTWIIVASLSGLKNTVQPETYLTHIALALAGFLFTIIGGWFAFRVIGGVIFTLFASVMVFFAGSVSASPVFVWFLIEYA